MQFATHRVGRFIIFLCLLMVAVVETRAAAQYTLLHGFAGAPSDGANPQYGSLATDGTVLYGLTLNGGTAGNGSIFKINVNGSGYQVMHSFAGLFLGTGSVNDGARPYGTPLLIGSTLYGTTAFGGSNGFGSIFKINTDGSGFALLYSFTSVSNGYLPYSSLVTDGATLYGMTASSSPSGLGVIFAIDTNGSNYHRLHTFDGSGSEGASPQGSLLLSGGTLYGMTSLGGTLGVGTLFKISTNGSGFQLVHTFTGTVTDGSQPNGSLIISNTTLYGMTTAGGSNNVGCVFSVDTSGAGFQILHSFSSTNTWGPTGDLTLSGSTLYGMARNSGFSLLGFGTIFQVNTDGTGFAIPHVFSYAYPNKLTDGSTPGGTLLLLGSQLYGMTYFGGSINNAGTVFSFNPNSSGGGGGGPVTALRVNILPATAVKAGAQWQVNGGSYNNSGTLLTNVTSGPHVIVYKAITGFAAPAPQIISITAGVTNTFSGTYTALDTTLPTLKVIAPTSKTSVNSNLFTATGTASDNVGVALVYYQLNGGAWTAASSGNSWTNWSAPNLNLIPGGNVIRFYAKDLAGNVSTTNSVTFTYVVSAPLAVNISPPTGGTLKPNFNGALLEIGKPFSMSAKAVKGFAFANWSGSSNTASAKLTFVMASNLTFTANFNDITRPVNVILSPTKSQVLSNASPTATGRAMDNAGVAAVWCRVNSGDWFEANLADGTNWQTGSLATQLLAGPNSISSYAVDAAGNISLTNTIVFTYVIQPVADWAPNSLNGLLAMVTPTSGAQELVGFDLLTFSQTSAANNGDSDDYGGGPYTYLKTDTNLAQLSLSITLPSALSNSIGPINLVFTNHYAGYFTNDDGDSGAVNVQVATPFIPATVIGKTLTGVSDHNGKTTKIKLATATTFTKTPANGSNSGTSSGNYTFARLSPVSGLFTLSFTSAADVGQTVYLQTTFTSLTGGTYFVMVFGGFGVLQDIDTGNFTM
jgi:uncharacterized repeat protein (TIGR03803 family)